MINRTRKILYLDIISIFERVNPTRMITIKEMKDEGFRAGSFQAAGT